MNMEEVYIVRGVSYALDTFNDSFSYHPHFITCSSFRGTITNDWKIRHNKMWILHLYATQLKQERNTLNMAIKLVVSFYSFFSSCSSFRGNDYQQLFGAAMASPGPHQLSHNTEGVKLTSDFFPAYFLHIQLLFRINYSSDNQCNSGRC